MVLDGTIGDLNYIYSREGGFIDNRKFTPLEPRDLFIGFKYLTRFSLSSFFPIYLTTPGLDNLKPFAAASIGQVHLATLKEDGR